MPWKIVSIFPKKYANATIRKTYIRRNSKSPKYDLENFLSMNISIGEIRLIQKRADKNQVTPLYACVKNDIPVADCKTGIFTIIFYNFMPNKVECKVRFIYRINDFSTNTKNYC